MPLDQAEDIPTIIGAKAVSSASAPIETLKEQKHKSNNPFTNGKFAQGSNSDSLTSTLVANIESLSPFEYIGTNISKNELRLRPFKTSNRILDDLKYTPALFKMLSQGRLQKPITSFLNSTPFAYKDILPHILQLERYETLILNNAVDYIPLVEKHELKDSNVTVSTVRGLIVSSLNDEINHFKIVILENLPPLSRIPIDKHEYHQIEKSMLSADDLNIMNDKSNASSNLIDDAFFKSGNSLVNHIMRVSVYTLEFTKEDLLSSIDSNLIKERYLRGIESSPDSQLNTDSIPGPVHCLQTLLKVLKGPINLPATEPIHTISKSKTLLDVKIDLRLLFEKFSFTLGDDEDSLIPPNLSLNPSLKEAYIRKAYELVFIGKSLKTSKVNDFDTKYSFSDNMAQVHSILSEIDKHSALANSRSRETNRYSFFIALSCCVFYQDELIIRCYENTVISDPRNKMAYVDCFKKIMENRSSGSTGRLASYHNSQYLKGFMYGYSDYEAALKILGIELIPSDDDVAIDAIIEMYKAATNSDPKNYAYYNNQVEKIAKIRDSLELKDFLANEIIPMSIALNELRIEEVTEDEVVITAFEFRLNDVMQEVNFNSNSPEVRTLQRSLYSVALNRKSYILLNYIEKKFPDLQQKMNITFSDALRILEVTADSTDFEIITNFQEKLARSSLHDPVDVRALRASLKRVAEERKSNILMSFLEQGKINPSLQPPELWPTGLDNIGNTCYLNSLLQYYFCIKPLRDMILNFDEANVKIDPNTARKIGGRKVEESELNRSFQFIYRLQKLFNEMISSKERCVQPSKELAYLAFLPLSQPIDFKDNSQLSSPGGDDGVIDSEFEPIIVDSESPESMSADTDMDKDNQDLIVLESTCTSPNLESAPSLNMVEVDSMHVEDNQVDIVTGKKILAISSDQIESTIELGRQQDVTECIENVTYQIETALEPEKIESDGEQFDLIKKLFCGKTKQTITPLGEEKANVRVSVERFFSLIINVGDHPKDIYDALDNYFNEDSVELEEGEVKKALTIQELPQVLQFHVQRVLFDRERLVAYKSLEVIPFGETIYVDRYLETDDEEIIAKRQEVFDWKSEMKKLYAEKDSILMVDSETKLSALDALKATLKYLESNTLKLELNCVKQSTIDSIRSQIHLLELKLQAIENKLISLQDKVSTQFDSYKQVGYSLFAIFIHRGEASYGHYWIYIKDPHRNIYRKYNDETVTEVPYSEVFNFTTTNTATPYYMVYVKSELMNEYVEPLKREIKC